MPTDNKTVTFSDILKNFSFTGEFGVLQLLLLMALAFAVGLFIFYIYKKSFNGVLYSRSFNVSLVMLTMVSALILRTITTNLTLSLGMVGALSIIRFRTAIKDPMDTVFMFWAVAVGIVLGAGQQFYSIGIIGSLIIGILIYFLNMPRARGSYAYLLIVRYDYNCANEVNVALNRLPRHSRLKSKTVTRNGIELTMEVRLPGDNTNLVNEFMRINGVYDATLISYQGDYAS